ncbi:MAG: hypothetical protein HY047_13235 [Acidobacteria bacterium]|nr:hypothetical protein [Acidobacteriota bacterium]
MRQQCARLAALAVVVVLGASVALAGQAAKVDVTGKWAFNVETSVGSGTPTFTFKQEGEKLTGHYSGQLGEADLTGTVKGQALSLKFTVDVQGNQIECHYDGTIESKDALKGKVSLVGLGDGTFTAKRQ